MIIEMRTYKTTPGKRPEFLEVFRTRSIPAHRALGMAISEPMPSVDDPDTFFFIRGFPDLASREAMKARFYESPLWKDDLEQVLMPMLAAYTVVVVEGPESCLGQTCSGLGVTSPQPSRTAHDRS